MVDYDQKVVESIIGRYGKEKIGGNQGTLKELLGLKARELISLVGAGGKTTLMFRVARDLVAEGKKVVVTTTTKILEPSPGEAPLLFVDQDERNLKQLVVSHLSRRRHLTLASERIGAGKLRGVSSSFVNDLWSSKGMDYLLVEADGASGCPIKAPREKEPVIPSDTTLVVALLGVDGVGSKLNSANAFQPDRISKLTGVPAGENVSVEAMAVLMTDREGIFKSAPPTSRVVAFLNKVDLPDGLVNGRRVAQKILEKRHPLIERIVLGQLKKEPGIAEVFFPSQNQRSS